MESIQRTLKLSHLFYLNQVQSNLVECPVETALTVINNTRIIWHGVTITYIPSLANQHQMVDKIYKYKIYWLEKHSYPSHALSNVFPPQPGMLSEGGGCIPTVRAIHNDTSCQLASGNTRLVSHRVNLPREVSP